MIRIIKYSDDQLFEMANLPKRESGLPYDVWIDSSGKERNVKHNEPRLKVKVNGKMIPIVISKEDPYIPKKILRELYGGHPFKGFAEIQSWITDNYETLMRHWNKELSDKEALTLLTR